MISLLIAVAIFGTDLQRWGFTNSTSPNVITLASGISAGTIAFLPYAYEAPFNVDMTSVTDSKGNTWQFCGRLDNSSVHRAVFAYSYITVPLVTSDTISITWSNKTGSPAVAGAIFTLTGCSASQAGVRITNGSFGNTWSSPGTVLIAGSILVGAVLNDQVVVTDVSVAPTWQTVKPDDTPGHSGSTDGMRLSHFTTNAPVAGAYDPGGSFTDISTPSWVAFWMEFQPANTVVPSLTMGGNIGAAGNMVFK